MAQRFFNQSSRVKYVKPYVNKRALPVQEEIKEQKNTDMRNLDIEKISELVGQDMDGNSLSRKTKVDKKDKGLIERAENTKIILTEDNKVLLND